MGGKACRRPQFPANILPLNWFPFYSFCQKQPHQLRDSGSVAVSPTSRSHVRQPQRIFIRLRNLSPATRHSSLFFRSPSRPSRDHARLLNSGFWLLAPTFFKKVLFCQTNPMLFNVFGLFEKSNPKTNPMKPNSHAPSKNEPFEKSNPIQPQTVSLPCLGIVPQCFDFQKLVSILLILSKTSPAVAFGFVFIRVHS